MKQPNINQELAVKTIVDGLVSIYVNYTKCAKLYNASCIDDTSGQNCDHASTTPNLLDSQYPLSIVTLPDCVLPGFTEAGVSSDQGCYDTSPTPNCCLATHNIITITFSLGLARVTSQGKVKCVIKHRIVSR